MNQNQENNVEQAAVAAIASASATPFRTAFKITIGIALAQLMMLAIVVGGLATVGTIIYAILK